MVDEFKVSLFRTSGLFCAALFDSISCKLLFLAGRHFERSKCRQRRFRQHILLNECILSAYKECNCRFLFFVSEI